MIEVIKNTIIGNPIAHLIGLIGTIILLVSTQIRKKEKLLFYHILYNFFYTIQYLLLNVLTASAMNIVSLIRSITFYKKKEKKNLYGILILSITVGIVTTLLDMKIHPLYLAILPLIITITYTFLCYQDNIKKMKIGFLICALIWAYYNYTIGAYIALIGNILEVLLNIIILIRMK